MHAHTKVRGLFQTSMVSAFTPLVPLCGTPRVGEGKRRGREEVGATNAERGRSKGRVKRQ